MFRSRCFRSDGGRENLMELVDLIATLAMDSINVQLRFNQANETAFKEFETMLAATDPSIRPLLAPLVPSRIQLDDFEMDLGVMLTKESEEEISIRAMPVGLGFSVTNAVRTDRVNRIHFSVKQFPIPEPVQ
jgi:hypothetical protein